MLASNETVILEVLRQALNAEKSNTTFQTGGEEESREGSARSSYKKEKN